MMMLGGATRLTHSGLSIVEWQPITGIIPPLTHDEWIRSFQGYQHTTEFKIRHSAMTLDEFKFIFWMEYSHRLLGRIIGFYILVPLFWLWIRQALPGFLKRNMVALLSLVAIQGFLGWYMVKSGLSVDPDVSPYRLTVHLLTAFVLIAIVLKSIDRLNMSGYITTVDPLLACRWRSRWAYVNLILVGIALMYGGLVAGHKAGLIYNTFPLMEGQFIPSEWLFEKPLWVNFIKNHATLQWVHRLLAYMLVLSAVVGIGKRYITPYYGLVIGTQVLLGIVTLVYGVPVLCGTLHQGWAVIVFTVAFRSTLNPYDNAKKLGIHRLK
jgi:cytochrome c oxidase assembly protein subunit 15